MRDFGIIVDSLTNQNFKEKIFKDASTVSLSFIMGDGTYQENKLSHDELFELMRNKSFKVLSPTTEHIIHAYNEQKRYGYDKVIFLVSSNQMVPILRNVMLAQTIINDPSFIVKETKTFGPGIWYLLEMMDYDIRCGIKFNEIIKNMDERIKEIKLLMAVKRLSNIEQLSGESKMKQTLLELTPSYRVVVFSNDNFEIIKTVFGYQTLIKVFKQSIDNYIKLGHVPHIKIFSGLSTKAIKELQHELYQENLQIALYGQTAFIISYLLGKDMLGILIADAG